MTAPKLVGLVSTLWAAALVALIVVSSLEMGLAEGMRRLLETRWGITTLVDLYAGLAVVAVWIGFCERSWRRAAVWAIALALTGNLTTLVYIGWRSLRAERVRDIFIP